MAAMLNAEIIPDLLTISSNRRNLKGFPLCEDLSVAKVHKEGPGQSILQIKFQVDPDLRISNRREGKAFKRLDSDFVGMEVPIGRMANVTCAISFSGANPELRVNQTFFRAGKLTIGNVHSVGWLLRDLCNVHLLRNGFGLIHGAALRSDSACVLLIGLSNTGKTTTVKRLISEIGAKTFGDDLLATDGKNAIACPYTGVNIAPSELARFNDRIMQRAKRVIPFYEYIGPTSKANLVGHFGNKAIAEPVKIGSIFFLRRAGKFRVSNMDHGAARNMLIASNAAEFTYSSNSLFHAYDFLMQSNVAAGAWEAETRLLDKLCSNSSCYLIDGDIPNFVSVVRDALGSGPGTDSPGI